MRCPGDEDGTLNGTSRNKMVDEEVLNLYVTLLLVVRLLHLKGKQNKRRKKRFWVRDIYRHRREQGEFSNLVQELRFGDREMYFR